MTIITLKKLSLLTSTASLSLIVSLSHAAGLNTFSNGTVANADDVNHNFTHLDDRITNISLTPGPAGPQGIAGVNGQNGLNGLDGATGPAGAVGPQGPAGADGTNGTDGIGIVFQNAAGFDSTAYSEKVFTVTGTQQTWDKEVRNYNRVNNGDGSITNHVTRQRTLAGNIIRHDVLQYITDSNGNVGYAEKKGYDPLNTSTLIYNSTISPPIEMRNSAMGIGLRWATASQVTQVFADASPDSISFAIDSRSLLGIEDITLSTGASYTGCLKIETIRTSQNLSVGQFQRINWRCPNNIGLVKSVMVRDVNGATLSRVMELDEAASTLIAP